MAKRKIDLPEFRAKLRELKSRGLSDLLHDVDTRKAIPSGIRGGRSLREIVDEFDDVLSGKAGIFKVSDTSEKAYRQNYQRKVFVHGRTGQRTEYIVVPHSADETVRLQNGKVVISHPAGIERTQIPVEYHNLEQWLEDLKKQKYAREKGVQYGFRFFGGSSSTFRTMDLLVDELEHYRTIEAGIAGSVSFQRELYRNIEIVKVLDKKKWFQQREKNKSREQQAKRKATQKRRKKK